MSRKQIYSDEYVIKFKKKIPFLQLNFLDVFEMKFFG